MTSMCVGCCIMAQSSGRAFERKLHNKLVPLQHLGAIFLHERRHFAINIYKHLNPECQNMRIFKIISKGNKRDGARGEGQHLRAKLHCDSDSVLSKIVFRFSPKPRKEAKRKKLSKAHRTVNFSPNPQGCETKANGQSRSCAKSR
jgi:hypothetical protein